MMGMTAQQARALECVLHHVELHGVTPSFRVLARAIGCASSGAQRLVDGLVERGHLERAAGGGIALPSLPPHLAQRLAGFCRARGENFAAVLHDAITIHLDTLAGVADELEAAE